MMKVIRSEPHDLPLQEELSTPQFDESAIAAAMPVLPLPPKPKRRFDLTWSPSKATVSGSVMGLLVTAVVGLSIARGWPDQNAADLSTKEVQLQPDSPPDTNAQLPEPASQKRKPAVRRYRRSEMQFVPQRYDNPAESFFSDDGKPAARKVGEFRYQ